MRTSHARRVALQLLSAVLGVMTVLSSAAIPALALTPPPGDPPGTPPPYCEPGVPQPCWPDSSYGRLTVSPNVLHEGDIMTASWNATTDSTTPIWPDDVPGTDYNIPELNVANLRRLGACDGSASCSYRVIYSPSAFFPGSPGPEQWGAFGITVLKLDSIAQAVSAPVWFHPESFATLSRLEDPEGVPINTPFRIRLQRAATTVTTYPGDTVVAIRIRAGLGIYGWAVGGSLVWDDGNVYQDLRASNPDLAQYFDADNFPGGLTVQVPAIDERSHFPFNIEGDPDRWHNMGTFRRGEYTVTLGAAGFRDSLPVTFSVPDETKLVDHAEVTLRLRYTLEPRPDFMWSHAEPAGTVHFVSTSTPGDNGNGPPIVDWQWDFGDGETGSGEIVDHVYDQPDDYLATLTVTDANGLSDSVTKTVAAGAPELDLTIESELASHPVGEAVPVKVTVSASEGLGSLTDLVFVGDPVHVFPVASGTASALAPSPTTPFVLAPGESKEFTGTVTLTKGGTIQLSSTVAGKDAAGRDVSAHKILPASVPTLEVTVTGDPCVRVIEGDPNTCGVDFAAGDDPADVTLSVQIKNPTTDKTFNNVVVDESLAVTAVGGGAADGLTEIDGPLSDVGPLLGGAIGTILPGQSRTVTYHVRATESGRFIVEVGAAGDATDSGGPGGGGGFGFVDLRPLAARLLGLFQDPEPVHVTASGKLRLDIGDSLSLTWEIEPRFTGPDDIADTPADANPDLYWFQATVAKADASECDHDLEVRWEADGQELDTTPVGGKPCTYRFSRTNLDEFELSAIGVPEDGSVINDATESVEAKDFLIASLGDSLSSGEGVSDGGSWTLAQCHRSIHAGSAQAALRVEESSPHSAVTFVHLACSGADVITGLLGSYDGIEEVGTMRQPQISKLRTIARDRSIDALVMSIGINDIKFAEVIKWCILVNCATTPEVGQELAGRLAILPSLYDAAAAALEQNGIAASDVFLLEYPDATKDDAGEYCSAHPNAGMILQAEWLWAYDNMMMPLNEAGDAATASHGWNRISGLDAAFKHHGLCATDTWVNNLVDSVAQQGSKDGAFHPNQSGHGVYGDYIFSALDGHLVTDTGTLSRPTQVGSDSSAGDDEIDVSNDHFDVGDEVTISPGSDHQETRTITGKGSLILDTPLDFTHEAGEPIILTTDVPSLTPTNRHPFAANDAASICSLDATLDVLANDSDLDGDSLGIRSVSSTDAEIVTGADGHARLAFHPPSGFTGATFTYEAVDPSGATDVGTVTLTAAAAPFSDVPLSHPFCSDIAWMRDANISTGFGDGTYRPAAVVTRQAMSAFMARLAGATLGTCESAPFSDVPTDHPFCREISWMKSSLVSTGFGDGTYRPGVGVTRQAMSAFMSRLAGATLAPCTQAPFSDVPVDHPFCREITWMKTSGVSTGFADGTYRPSADVTRQAMSAFMHRVSALLD
jgi:hypothetical protein